MPGRRRASSCTRAAKAWCPRERAPCSMSTSRIVCAAKCSSMASTVVMPAPPLISTHRALARLVQHEVADRRMDQQSVAFLHGVVEKVGDHPTRRAEDRLALDADAVVSAVRHVGKAVLPDLFIRAAGGMDLHGYILPRLEGRQRRPVHRNQVERCGCLAFLHLPLDAKWLETGPAAGLASGFRVEGLLAADHHLGK